MAETHTSSGADTREGGGIINRVKESATEQLTTQKNRGTDALGRIAGAVRESTQKLRDERHDTIAGYIDQAADRIERVSQQLRDKDINELVSDMQRLARRQPAVFIGSAFALGVLGARFLKSSRPRQAGDDYAAESRRTRYGGDTARGTVHDYSGRDRETDPVVASEVGISEVESEQVMPLTPGGVEGATRSARPRRSTSRTGQP
jgi:hypothetical protein